MSFSPASFFCWVIFLPLSSYRVISKRILLNLEVRAGVVSEDIDEVVVDWCVIHGIDNIRGGTYVDPDLTEQDLNALNSAVEYQVNHDIDLESNTSQNAQDEYLSDSSLDSTDSDLGSELAADVADGAGVQAVRPKLKLKKRLVTILVTIAVTTVGLTKPDFELGHFSILNFPQDITNASNRLNQALFALVLNFKP